MFAYTHTYTHTHAHTHTYTSKNLFTKASSQYRDGRSTCRQGWSPKNLARHTSQYASRLYMCMLCVYMYTCVYTCVDIYMCVWACVNSSIYVYTCACIFKCVYVCIHTHTHILRLYIQTCIPINLPTADYASSLYMYMYIYIYSWHTYEHMCKHVNIHMHTYIAHRACSKATRLLLTE